MHGNEEQLSEAGAPLIQTVPESSRDPDLIPIRDGAYWGEPQETRLLPQGVSHSWAGNSHCDILPPRAFSPSPDKEQPEL